MNRGPRRYADTRTPIANANAVSSPHSPQGGVPGWLLWCRDLREYASFLLARWDERRVKGRFRSSSGPKRDPLRLQRSPSRAAKTVSIRPVPHVPRNPTTKFKTPSAPPPPPLPPDELRVWQSRDQCSVLSWVIAQTGLDFCLRRSRGPFCRRRAAVCCLCTREGFGGEIPASPLGGVRAGLSGAGSPCGR